MDGGVAAVKLPLPKRVFSVSLKRGDFIRGSFTAAKPTNTISKHITRRWEKRDLATLYTYTLSWSSIHLDQYTTMEYREPTKRTVL